MNTKTEIDKLLDVVATLRGEGGCPWDREQTLETLKPYLVEEAYEVIDAIEQGSVAEHQEELGDLLLQIVMQSQIQTESGEFGFSDVARSIRKKMVSRHPHVFGDVKVVDSDEVLRNWEKNKAKDKDGEHRSILAGVPKHLPALQKAQRVQSRAALVGFDWKDVKDVLAKVEEELAETKEAMNEEDEAHICEEIGDLLFSVVNLARFYGMSAEDALNKTTLKFTSRFAEIERCMHEQKRELKDCSLEEMDAIWEGAKDAKG